MKWNKYYGYVIAISVLMLLLSDATDPIIDGLLFLIIMIVLNSVFGVFCKGWRQILAICFAIFGVFMCFRVVQLQRTFDKRVEQILSESANKYSKTNTPASIPPTNSVH
jgi:hypothetical protein